MADLEQQDAENNDMGVAGRGDYLSSSLSDEAVGSSLRKLGRQHQGRGQHSGLGPLESFATTPCRRIQTNHWFVCCENATPLLEGIQVTEETPVLSLAALNLKLETGQLTPRHQQGPSDFQNAGRFTPENADRMAATALVAAAAAGEA